MESPPFKIVLSQNEMSAWLHFQTDSSVSLGSLQEAIAAAGIIYGLDEFLLSDLAEAHQTESPYCIATGREPEAGLKYHFPIQPTNTPKRLSGGRVDFYNLDTVTHVTQGQELVCKLPVESRQQGCTVTGEPIPPSNRDYELPQSGLHVTLADDEQSLVALADGYPVLQDDVLSVEPTYTVEGDVDFSVGNLNCSGHVAVMGDLKNGFQVKGLQNVTIYGVVDGGSIEAGGKVLLYSNVFGNHQSRLISNASVEGLYLDATSVKTRKDIILMRGALHCDLYAGGSVLVQGYEGQIIGGSVRAHERILTHDLGSERAIPTEVEIRPGAYDIETVSHYLNYLNAVVEDDRTFIEQGLDWQVSIEQRNDLHQALRQCGSAMDKLSTYFHKSRLLLPVRPLQIGSIVVTGTVYPGVTVTIGEDSMPIREPMTQVMFYLSDRQVQVKALEETIAC